MITVSKDFTFDAAHRLVKGYEGKCAHLHGHTYKAQLTVGKEESKLDQYDFIMNFDRFKDVKAWVDANWDHATLFNGYDQELKKFLDENKQKSFEFHTNPTVEIMCAVLRVMAQQLLGSDVTLLKVTIWETPTSQATWERDKDNEG